jgi:hypothetical protein
MTIPDNITKQDVLDAMARIGTDPSRWPFRSQSTGYDIVHPQTGDRYPPKLVLSEAAQIATGGELSRRTFSGGERTNRRLEDLGFKIVPK